MSESGDKVNILLVDDQPAKLLSYEAMLSGLGENLIKASSGREALDHLLKTEITVVLMDVSMPELNGFELAEIIHQHPRFQKTAIIFVSAVHLTDLDQVKGYESGAVDYVSVPVIPEVLRAKIGVFTELYRKRREAEQLNRELEQRVADRTRALEDSMTRQLELTEQLREADRRKDEFLAQLSHELRNPLAPLSNAIGIMRVVGLDNPDLIRCREIIERQVNQLSRLVDDLLDVSRITQGKINLRHEVVDLASVVAGAIETSRPVIDAQHHALVVTSPDRPVRVSGDRARLIQVVANLLNNAARYQSVRGRIEVSISRISNLAELRVKDWGFGIAPEVLTRVFDLFAQGERPPDHAQGGLGIGLSLVKRLVEMHGGTVSGASAGPGQGSEFVIRLPTLRAEKVQAPLPEAMPELATATTPRTILVVDDNRDAANSLALLLRLNGHEVLVAHEGTTAFDLAISRRPMFIFLDIGLPGMDGYEVCRKVREHGLVDTQIIALTGYGQDRDRQRSLEAGFDGHTVKPVALREVMRILNEKREAISEKRGA